MNATATQNRLAHYFGESDPLRPEDWILQIADAAPVPGVDVLDLANVQRCPDCGRPLEIHVDADGQEFYCVDCLTFGICSEDDMPY